MSRANRDEYNEYMREYMLRRYHKRRGEAIILLGGKCVKCGSTHELEFDHVDRADKEFNVAKIWSYKKEKFYNEIQKCQLLCKTCHLLKTKSESTFTHGKWWGYYKHKCRCNECQSFADAFNTERRKKRRVSNSAV